MKHIMTFLIIAPYKYSYSYLLTYLLTSTVYNVKYICCVLVISLVAKDGVRATYVKMQALEEYEG